MDCNRTSSVSIPSSLSHKHLEYNTGNDSKSQTDVLSDNEMSENGSSYPSGYYAETTERQIKRIEEQWVE